MKLFYITEGFIKELEDAAKNWMKNSIQHYNASSVERFKIKDDIAISDHFI